MKLKYTEMDRDGKTYVFVSKGAVITQEEIEGFFDDSETKSLKIPDNLHRIFIQDLSKMSLKFCMQKYNASKEELRDEANRVAPWLSRRFLEDG